MMMLTLSNVITVLGLLSASQILYRISCFIWVYFLRSTSVHNYLIGPAPYALITGASDGIGKAVALRLYREGFNLIIHGRNEDKMKIVAAEIKTSQGTNRHILVFVADATQPEHDFQNIMKPFKDLDITIVVNNVGGGIIKQTRIDTWTTEEALGIIRLNALFPLHLIQALLPQLRKSPGPVLVLQIGSFAARVPPLRLSLYGASKRFLQSLSWSLSIDERYPTPTNVEFMYLTVNKVSTKGLGEPPSLFCPDTDTFAKSIVNKIGCGRQEITPYAPHAIQNWGMAVLGDNIAARILADTMKRMIGELEANSKKGN